MSALFRWYCVFLLIGVGFLKVGVINTDEEKYLIDFKTGEILPGIPSNNMVDWVSNLLHQYSYPGELDLLSIDWVTDMALEVNRVYQPDFIFLSYATPYLISLFMRQGQYDWDAIRSHLFAEVNRFTSQTGYTPYIIGSGGTLPLEGEVDLTSLDGIVTASRMGPVYAGLYQPSERDLHYLNELESVQMILPRERLHQVWVPGINYEGPLPDYLLVAARGFAFRTANSSRRPLYRVNARDNSIPVAAPEAVKSITDISVLIRKRLRKERVALIVLEGIDLDHFYPGAECCSNTFSWYTYLPGEGQYLAMTTGKHLPDHPYPPGYRDYEDFEGKAYPLSGYYRTLPEGTLGSISSIRSAAVGSRSVMTHIAAGADITIEGYTRSMQRLGSMAIVDTVKTRKRRKRRR